MRAGVDTNVWVSAVLNPHGRPAQVREALQHGAFTLVTSQPLLEELVEVMARPRIAEKYSLGPRIAAELAGLIASRSEVVEVSGSVRLCRDPDDDVLLETAINGRADVIVTRDEDVTRDMELIQLLKERGIRVLTVQHFLAELDL